MTFIVIGVLVFLIILVFRRYKTLLSVLVTISFITGITTAVLIAGLAVLSEQSLLQFFYTGIGRSEFYHLMAAWYAMDLLCASMIIRRYRDYKAINRDAANNAPRS